jgi:general stress protein 26
MEKEFVIEKGMELIKNSKIALVGSIDNDGFPNIKAMMNLESDGLKKIWFSTNTSSKRVSYFQNNPSACVYYVDSEKFMGLMLVGTIEVTQDDELRKRLWADGCEVYYPLGVTDPDYSVLCFTAKKGNFYQGLKNIDFEIESLKGSSS